jgi:hypothetical protein
VRLVCAGARERREMKRGRDVELGLGAGRHDGVCRALHERVEHDVRVPRVAGGVP